jgi:hypothetical protein
MLLLFSLFACRAGYAAYVQIDSIYGTDGYVDNGETLYISGGGWDASESFLFGQYFIYKTSGGSSKGTNYITDYNITIDEANDSIYGWIYDVGTFDVSDSVDEAAVLVSLYYMSGPELLTQSAMSDAETVDHFPPDTVEDLAVMPWPAGAGSDSDSVRITFNWPDENYGISTDNPVSSITIKYYSQPIDDETDWDNATEITCTMPDPQDPDQLQTLICNMYDEVPGTYYYAIRTVDNMGYESVISYETTGAKTKPVVLSVFTAAWQGNTVFIYWKTESEVDNLLWRLKRSTSLNGVYELIHERLKEPGEQTTAHPTEYSYTDQQVVTEQDYYYLLIDVDLKGRETRHGPIVLAWNDNSIPDPGIRLKQNRPHPVRYNSSTVFSYYLPEVMLHDANRVVLRIYDINGSTVKTLIDGTYHLQQSDQSIIWNGKDDNGVPVSEGIYIYKLTVNNIVQTRQFMILK